MEVCASGQQKSTPAWQANTQEPPIPTVALHHLYTDPKFSLRSRVFLAVVHVSCTIGRATGEYWTPPITAPELARVWGRHARTMSRLMLSLVDSGNLERRPVKLSRGGWAWSYRAIDITAERQVSQ